MVTTSRRAPRAWAPSCSPRWAWPSRASSPPSRSCPTRTRAALSSSLLAGAFHMRMLLGHLGAGYIGARAEAGPGICSVPRLGSRPVREKQSIRPVSESFRKTSWGMVTCRVSSFGFKKKGNTSGFWEADSSDAQARLEPADSVPSPLCRAPREKPVVRNVHGRAGRRSRAGAG